MDSTRITKLRGVLINDSRISDASAEAIKGLTADNVEALQFGKKDIRLEVNQNRLKSFLEKATLTEKTIGIYTRYLISDLSGYTLGFNDGFDTDFAQKYALYIVPENREFEFENNGAKYKFKWNHDIILNLGLFENRDMSPSSVSYVTLSSTSEYTNCLNLTEKVLQLNNNSGWDEHSRQYQYIRSYKKYTIKAGAVTSEEDIDVEKAIFESDAPDTYNITNYTITKIDE